MTLRAPLAVVLAALLAPAAAAAQNVTLEFGDGQVTLSARNAPVRAILAEWSRLGAATIVNGDLVAGPPITIELAGVSERQALDVVLRGVAGYMLAPRPAGAQGASAYNRIVILPTSVAPRNPPPPANAAAARRTIVRPPALTRQPELNDEIQDDTPMDDVEQVMGQDPTAVAQPQPGSGRIVQPPFVMRPPVLGDENAQGDGGDGVDPAEDAPAGAVAPTSANPFGIPAGSSALPGVISPVPQPQGPNRATPNRVQ